jgi:hypothetical protein
VTDIDVRKLQDLRPGMIMLGPIGGLVGLGVAAGQLALGEGLRMGSLDIRHAGIVSEASETLPPMSIYRDQLYETGIMTAPRLVQAMPSGAEEVDMRQDVHWSERHAYVWLPEEYPGQNLDAARIAQLMVGIPYSWASYLSLALFRFHVRPQRLMDWIDRRQAPVPVSWPSGRQDSDTGHLGVRLPVEAICSVLADQAQTLTGRKLVYGTQPQAVTPARLAQALLEYPGAQWFRPVPRPSELSGWGVNSWTVGG